MKVLLIIILSMIFYRSSIHAQSSSLPTDSESLYMSQQLLVEGVAAEDRALAKVLPEKYDFEELEKFLCKREKAPAMAEVALSVVGVALLIFYLKRCVVDKDRREQGFD